MLRRRSPFVLSVALVVAACGGSASPGPASKAPSVGVAASATVSTAPATPLPSYPTVLPTLAPPPVDLSKAPARFHVEPSTSTSAWIGPAGGSLTATAADGTSFTLDIPAGAVAEPTPITMTPIQSVDALGLSGGMAGSVYLQPVGQRFAVPGVLRIVSTRRAPAGTRLIGFDVDDDGTTDLLPATEMDGAVAVPVFHFSDPGAGFGTADDLKLIAPPVSNPTTADPRIGHYIASLYAEPVPWGRTTQLEALTLVDVVWQTLVKDELTTAATDHDLVIALADWRQLVFLVNLLNHLGDTSTALADGAVMSQRPQSDSIAQQLITMNAAALILVHGHIVAAMDGNKDICTGSHDLGALANLQYWANLGTLFAPETEPWKDRAKGCATVDVESFNPATNLRAGGTDSLQVSFGLVFSDGTHTSGDFDVQLSAQGFSFTTTGSPTSTAGDAAGAMLTIPVTATTAGPYVLSAVACWSLRGVPRGLCSDQLQRTFGPVPTGSAPGPAGSGGPVDFNAPCMIFGWSGTWTNLDSPSHIQLAGGAGIRTACQGGVAALNGLVADGQDVTQERIIFAIAGSTTAFTATELSCPGSGLPNAGCSGATTVEGAAGPTLSLIIKATKSGEGIWSFTGQLVSAAPNRG